MKGLLLIDKPEGISSFDVIRHLRPITKLKKMGHTGTLDPFASGLLPVLVGKATKVASYLSSKKKTYMVKMKLGTKTDTGDITGRIVEDLDLNRKAINEKIESLKQYILNLHEQVPPPYSAVKIKGVPAYKLARRNLKVHLNPKKIEIFNFQILNIDLPFIEYKVTVSKGTYIRVLSETIGHFLDNAAVTVSLRRIAIDEIKIEDSVKLNNLNSSNWKKHIIKITALFPNSPKYILSKKQLVSFKNGHKIKTNLTKSPFVLALKDNQECVGFGYTQKGYLYPKKVLVN